MAFAKSNTVCVPLLFTANDGGDVDQATILVHFPSRVTVDKVRVVVNQKLSAGDAATVTLQDKLNASKGSVSFPASTVIGTADAINPTAPFIVAAGDFVQLVPSKVTPGGAVLAFIEYTQIGG